MPSLHLQFIAALAALSTLANAYTVTFYSGKGCRGSPLGSIKVSSVSPCSRELAGTAASAIVDPEEDDLNDASAVVFFNGDNCDPDDIMKDGEAIEIDGCYTGNFGSFEAWKL